MAQFAYFCGTEQFQPEVLLEHAVRAEAVGFDALAVSDHFHPWVDDASASAFVWSWLGALAIRTRRARIATAVTCPLFRYHPALVAQAEAVAIMRRLLDGEKLDFAGKFYRTQAARLYSPPLARVPIWMAAGGPQSATLAGRLADGLIVSVKAPEDAREQVIDPCVRAARDAGRPKPTVVAQRWSILARDEGAAWQALRAWRGLRVEGRLDEVDPSVLRARADAMDRREILGKYAWARTAEELVEIYRPLVEVGADIVTVQVTSVDQDATIGLLGEQVLPALRRLAGPA